MQLPAGTILGPYESREDWLQARRAGLGGSDIGAILGLSTFSSELEIYESKISGREAEVNEAMEIGRDEEPVILDRWLRQNPNVEVRRDQIIIQSDVHPYLIHSPDAIGEEYPLGGIYFGIEVKNIRSDHNWSGEFGIPEFYYAQVQHGLLCSGFDRWVVIARVGGQKDITREIEPDREYQGRIALAAERFWNTYVLPRVPPEPDGSDSAKRALERKWEASEGKVDIDPGLWEQLAYHQRRLDQAEKAMAKARQMVMAKMGEAEIALVEGKKVATWKVSSRTSIDTKRLRDEDPKLAKKYERTTSTRVFRLS
jgi:putative phage-type endonuclease